MITAALFVAALIKTQDFAVPPGASSEFRKLALEIESAIAAKDFPAGSKLVALLPNTSATYRIDLTKVAESQRASYKAAIVKAANSWQASLANGVILTPAQVGMTDIRFQFEPSIVSSGKSVSAMWQWIPKTSPPQLSATFAMKRATGQASATDVTNNARITFEIGRAHV